MNTRILAPDSPAHSEAAARVASLLKGYPAISPAEIDEIVDFLKAGPHLEVGGLNRDDTVRERLTRFRRDQRHRLTPGWIASGAFALAILVPIALVCAWFAGG